MFKWLSNLFDTLTPKPHIWYYETHGSWIRISENNKIVYTGNIADMPPNIKRRYKSYITTVQKIETEIENIHKQFMEFEQYVPENYRGTKI